MTPQPEIFISYAWKDREQSTEESRELLVDQLCQAFAARGYPIIRDKSALSYRDSIEKFMKRIGEGHFVIAVISDKYLRSDYCMYEALQLLAHEDVDSRVFPVVLPDADIFSDNALEYKVFWKKRLENFSRLLQEAGDDSGSAEWRLKERNLKAIHEHVSEWITRIARMNVLSAQAHLEQGFQSIIEAVEAKMRAMQAPAAMSEPLAPLPRFAAPDRKALNFKHALRPEQTQTVGYQVQDSWNIIAPPGWGLARFVQDLLNSGIKNSGIQVVQIKVPLYRNAYASFLDEVAAQLDLVRQGKELVDLVREAARRQGKPVLLVLFALDGLLDEGTGQQTDALFDIRFLQKLNSLKNAEFAALLVTSHRSISDSAWMGLSSPLYLNKMELAQLNDEIIRNEIARTENLDLDGPVLTFLSESVEFDPNQSWNLLYFLLQQLRGRKGVNKKEVGLLLNAFRSKNGNHGR